VKEMGYAGSALGLKERMVVIATNRYRLVLSSNDLEVDDKVLS
jgi:hypothetical protein